MDIAGIRKLPIFNTFTVLSLLAIVIFTPFLILFSFDSDFVLNTDLIIVLILTTGFGALTAIINIGIFYFVKFTKGEQIDETKESMHMLKWHLISPLFSSITSLLTSYLVLWFMIDSKLVETLEGSIKMFLLFNIMFLISYSIQTIYGGKKLNKK